MIPTCFCRHTRKLEDPQSHRSTPTDVPPDIQGLLEHLAERLNIAANETKLELRRWSRGGSSSGTSDPFYGMELEETSGYWNYRPAPEVP